MDKFPKEGRMPKNEIEREVQLQPITISEMSCGIVICVVGQANAEEA